MRKISQQILRKCKTLSRQLTRTTSYSSLRSKSTREQKWGSSSSSTIGNIRDDDDHNYETIFVGSTRKRYVISSKYLDHPLLNALIEKSKQCPDGNVNTLSVKCEVVLFDHLLWMLDNAEPNLTPDSLEELADLYVF